MAHINSTVCHNTLSLARIHCSNQEIYKDPIFQSAGLKLGQGHQNLINNSPPNNVIVSLINIHQLVQKIMHINHILDISKCQCDHEN